MSDATLAFLKNEAGEKEGLGDAGIETFRDAPYASCAREAGQNARDAEAALPIRMTFNVLTLAPNEFPARETVLRSLERCASEADDEKEEEFFCNAIKVVKSAQIPVLEIADYNTKGLSGPADEPGTPFHSLLKASGVSKKESDTAGGSFGIGKNASFAVSDLQMVLYSTQFLDLEAQSLRFASQGRIRLVSHSDHLGNKLRATGYWGNADGFRAITDPSKVPAWMRRSERGTSIFSMGFRESEDWAENMTASLVANFFCAFHRNEIEIDVDDGRLKINANTVESLLVDPKVRAAADKAGYLPDLEFAAQLHRCLISPSAEVEEREIRDLGRVRIRILAEEKMPRRVGFIRNGMLITDNLRYFNQPLARFPSSKDFIAIVEPASDECGRLFKRLENPRHDGFSAQRIADPVKRASAEAAMRKLGKTLRETIKENTGVEHQASVVLDELARFFADTGRDDQPRAASDEADPETFRFTPAKSLPVRRKASTTTRGTDGGAGGRGGTSGGNGASQGPGRGTGAGGRGNLGERESVRLEDVRNTIKGATNGGAPGRLLYFTPATGGKIAIRVEATGVDSPDVLTIVATDKGTTREGSLTLEVNAGERYAIGVTLSEPYSGPIEVSAALDDSLEVTA